MPTPAARAARAPDGRARHGHTLPEIGATLAIAAILAAIALPRAQRALDSAAVHAARDELVTLLADARRRAQWRGERVSLAIDGRTGSVHLLTAAGDTMVTRQTASVHGVALAADRAAVVYAPSGLGYGASNVRITIDRGAAADTILVSRLGRVRW